MKKAIITNSLLTLNQTKEIGNAAIVIEDDRITALTTISEVAELSETDIEIIDATEYSVLPGLIDTHVHLAFSASKDPLSDLFNETQEQVLLRMAGSAQQALRAGITTLRDCGAPGDLVLIQRDAINRGIIQGPRLVAAGRALTTHQGHCYFVGLEAEQIDDLTKAVEELVRQEVDFIKVILSGGNMTPGSNPAIDQYNFEQLLTIVKCAHSHNKKVGAHVHTSSGIKNAVAAGVDILEHCSWMSTEGTDFDKDTVKKMVEKEIYVCPAIPKAYRMPANMAFSDPQKIEAWERQVSGRLETTKMMAEMGVRIIAGTDAGSKLTPFDDLLATLDFMVNRIGLTPFESIQSTTQTAAQALGLEKEIGTIEKGKKADLLIVKGNPLKDIRNLQNKVNVIKNGDLVF